jgi:hypothetical protein
VEILTETQQSRERGGDARLDRRGHSWAGKGDRKTGSLLYQRHQERLISHDEHAAVCGTIPTIDLISRATPQGPHGQIQSKWNDWAQQEPGRRKSSLLELQRTLFSCRCGWPDRPAPGSISHLVCLPESSQSCSLTVYAAFTVFMFL